MTTRGRELVAANEPTVASESLLDPIVMEDGQSDERLPDPAGTNESDGVKLSPRKMIFSIRLQRPKQVIGAGEVIRQVH